MASSLTTPLPAIHPVLDPLQATFADDADPASGREGTSELECQLEIEDDYGSDSFRRIGEFLNPYSYDTDQAFVFLHRSLSGALAFQRPDLTSSAVQQIDGLVKRYRVQSRDVVDGIEATAFSQSAIFHAWLAGQSYVHNLNDLVSDSAYLFLTSRPLARRLFKKEKITLSILPLISGAATLRTVVKYLDGTPDDTFSSSLGSLTQYRPVYWNYTLPANFDLIKSVDIDITGLTGTAEKLTYRLIHHRPKYFSQIYYGNSLGGFDSLPLTGVMALSNQPTGEVFETAVVPDHDGQEGTYRTFNQKSHDSMILRTGYMPLEEKLALKDMTLRNHTYLVEGNKLRKLLLENTDHLMRTDGVYQHTAEFTARFAFDNLAYSR
ncbi:hypothetical protein DN752_17750 [Echinicola strongylocentroti]|uniref:Uncharacterized protein n=1 Tax=Echinicola strongylocentroti TaxID=1795355 RepID=A0A2Z4IMK4_9BACT|nr:hypothetical protein [Echinicola strongylocentroti]AWW31826.1 hypothetical protein DN752_17750 [Echinicola strongylocentroti]